MKALGGGRWSGCLYRYSNARRKAVAVGKRRRLRGHQRIQCTAGMRHGPAGGRRGPSDAARHMEWRVGTIFGPMAWQGRFCGVLACEAKVEAPNTVYVPNSARCTPRQHSALKYRSGVHLTESCTSTVLGAPTLQCRFRRQLFSLGFGWGSLSVGHG